MGTNKGVSSISIANINLTKSTGSKIYNRRGNSLPKIGLLLKKIIDTVSIIIFAISTYLSIVIDNKTLFILLGIIVFLFFLIKIITTPASILTFLFLINHPFSLTFGQTEVPFLGAGAILLINLIALGVWLRKNT